VLTNRLRQLAGEERGFTLLEALIAVAILVSVAGVLSIATVQVLSTQRTWQPNALAVQDIRHSLTLFAGDALNASTTTVPGLLTAVDSATLSWTDTAGTDHEAKYYLDGSGETLIRERNGNPFEVAENVQSVEFKRLNNLIELSLSVEGASGVTKSMSVRSYMRMLR